MTDKELADANEAYMAWLKEQAPETDFDIPESELGLDEESEDDVEHDDE